MAGQVDLGGRAAERTPQSTLPALGAYAAAAGLALSGLAMIAGSFMTWDECSSSPCGGVVAIWVIVERSGVDLGIGFGIAVVGLALAVGGAAAAAHGGRSAFRADGSVLALLVLLALAAYVVRAFVAPDFHVDGPEPGVYLVALGGSVAAVAALRLQAGDESQAAWAAARRLPLALSIAAAAVWLAALSGLLGSPIAPLAYAVVLAALAVGRWPARLPATRAEPPTLGLLMLAYAGVAVAAVVFWNSGPALLEASPIVFALAAVAAALLELPLATPRPTERPGWVDRATMAIGSSSGLRVAALGLTIAAVLVAALALPGIGDVYLRLRLAAGAPVESPWLPVVLAGGVALAAGIAIAYPTRPPASGAARRGPPSSR